jgi:hypothetical protein
MPLTGEAKTAYQREYMRRRRAGNGTAALAVGEPTSWKVVAIAKDGTHWGTGVRLATEAEADMYRMVHAHYDLWFGRKREREDPIIITATLTVPTNDPHNCQMKKTKRGGIKPTLEFLHGTCGLLDWEPLRDEDQQ